MSFRLATSAHAFLNFPRLLVHGTALLVVAMVIAATAQPLFSEDTWWHLGMGHVYAAEGPWIAADPFIHAAPGPPAPAAWLGSLGFYGVERVFGFHGLRAAGAILAAAILGLCWWLVRSVSESTLYASLATILFASLSAYRLFQVRPHLFTLLASLLLYQILILPRRPVSGWRIGFFALLMGFWANLHGAFILGPVLGGAALAGLLVSACLKLGDPRQDLMRARNLSLALGAGVLATLLNPSGYRVYLPYFVSGGESPTLGVVRDEWAPIDLLALPPPNIPPTMLSWCVAWILVWLIPIVLAWQIRVARRRGEEIRFDLATAAMAIAGLVGLLSAVRLLWLVIFPLLFLGGVVATLLSRRPSRRPALGWVGAFVAVVLLGAFVRFGDWPLVSPRDLRTTWAQPYEPLKFNTHAVWFLGDAGLEGNLFNDYADGNFLGYWLAPKLKVFINGSLNVTMDRMRARRAILAREGTGSSESFLELLDDWKINVFFARGVPAEQQPGRPNTATTTFLERSPGWIPVFRNLRGGVYLRESAENEANLERVSRFYETEGVPFDREQGFDAARVVDERPDWAIEHALLPTDFPALARAARGRASARRSAALAKVASIFATLGVYERALDIDRRLLQMHPDRAEVARRLVWCLLHLGRYEEAIARSAKLAQVASRDDRLAHLIVTTARDVTNSTEAERRARMAGLPLFPRTEMRNVLAGLQVAEIRPSRHRRPNGYSGVGSTGGYTSESRRGE